MGEKNGTLFVILIVIGVAAVMMFVFPDFFKDAANSIGDAFTNMIQRGEDNVGGGLPGGN